MPRRSKNARKQPYSEFIEELWGEEAQQTKFMHEKKHNIHITPLNEKQNQLWSFLNNPKKTVVVAHGCAGTGKSYLAMAYAAKELVAENYDKLILTRSSIPSTQSLGFFPGTVDEKLAPWLSAYVGYLKEFLGNGTVDVWMKPNQKRDARIILQPMEVLRGSSWRNAIVLVEEVQNLSFKELVMILTRVGENCKIILSGDMHQTDIDRCGLIEFLALKDKYGIDEVAEVEFTSDEIVRSGFVKSFIQALEARDEAELN